MGAKVASLQETDTNPLSGAISIANALSFVGKTKDVNGNAAVFSNVTDKVANYTDANVAAIVNLGAQVTGIGFSDTVANINTAKTQLLSWMVGSLHGYNLSLTLPDSTILQSFTSDGQTLLINAANAAGFANKGLNFPLKVQDTTANLNTVKLHALASLGSQLVSIFDPDQINSYGSVITQAISVADVLVLAPKSTDYYNGSDGWHTGGSLLFNNVSNLSNLNLQISIKLSDTVANINANQANLSSLASLATINLPDGTSFQIGFTVNGSGFYVIAHDAVKLAQEGITFPVNVVDTDANVFANADALAKLGVQIKSNTHVTSVGIVDSATNILAGLDNLQANAAKLSAITSI